MPQIESSDNNDQRSSGERFPECHLQDVLAVQDSVTGDTLFYVHIMAKQQYLPSIRLRILRICISLSLSLSVCVRACVRACLQTFIHALVSMRVCELSEPCSDKQTVSVLTEPAAAYVSQRW